MSARFLLLPQVFFLLKNYPYSVDNFLFFSNSYHSLLILINQFKLLFKHKTNDNITKRYAPHTKLVKQKKATWYNVYRHCPTADCHGTNCRLQPLTGSCKCNWFKTSLKRVRSSYNTQLTVSTDRVGVRISRLGLLFV